MYMAYNSHKFSFVLETTSKFTKMIEINGESLNLYCSAKTQPLSTIKSFFGAHFPTQASISHLRLVGTSFQQNMLFCD